jgi:poly(A) polymerase
MEPTTGLDLLRVAVRAGSDPFPPSRTDVEAARAHAAGILELDPESVYRELTAAITGRHPEHALQWLYDTGALVILLPELAATVAFSQEAGRRHKDVWEHTKAVVRQAVPRPEVRWAAVLHDIGKVPTRRFLPGGKVTFHGHAEEGVRMFRRGPARRIAFPPQVRERVEALILHHLRGGQYDGSWSDAAVRRFGREMGPLLRDLLDLSRADVTSRRPGKRKRCMVLISELARRIRELEAEDARPKPLPAGLGNLLMEAFALPPGKHLAVLRDRLQELCDAGDLVGGESGEYYVAAVREWDLLAGIEVRAAPRCGP